MSAKPSKLDDKNQKPEVPKPRATKLYALSLRHYIVLAVTILLSTTGMVELQHFVFVFLSYIYMYFLSLVAFPILSTSPNPRLFTPKQLKIMAPYVLVSAIVGLLLPIAYIVEGFFWGDKEDIKAAVPHLFLLLNQVFMEGVGFSDKFSLPIRVYVPVVYNSVRLFSLTEWLRTEFSKEIYGVEEGGNTNGATRLYIGRGIAVANMVFWCFNLFGFLLPVWLPKIFKAYYSAPSLATNVKT